MEGRSKSDESDSDDSSMFESSSSSSPLSQPEKKKRRLNESPRQNVENSNTDQNGTSKTVDPVLLEQAKSRLSKFAARLFDPNRIRGLVEAPAVIPLNDEFLKAFGKREKEMDQLRGHDEKIDHKIADNDDETGDGETIDATTPQNTSTPGSSKKKKKKESVHKVKVNNLAYRTTEETLHKNCLVYGNVVEVNMVLDGPVRSTQNNIHNSGRAYVTFETEEGAQSCIDGLKSLDGRKLRCTLALARPPKSSGGSGRTSASLLNNQSTRDISTICFRCGQVGHMESNCPNPAKPKPCCLCGSTNHEFRACPSKQICFNCGQPGHVSRDCTFRRGLPRRMVCGNCFQSGHHRLQCNMRGPMVSISEAICMDTGKRGRFMSKPLKWFYGLRGMSCFNCGGQGHSGYDCNRPTLYQCINNPDTAVQEIERAEANSIAEELERERRQQRERDNYRDGGRKHKNGGNENGKRRRAKSSNGRRKDRRGY